jgi:hypothetical protein
LSASNVDLSKVKFAVCRNVTGSDGPGQIVW